MLTDPQKSKARHDGGKEIANKKRHAAHVKTALVNLRNDCNGGSADLAGLLTQDEIDTLTQAVHIVDRIAATLEKDAAEAKRIKADYDKRVKAATDVLNELPHATPADIIALAAFSGGGALWSFDDHIGAIRRGDMVDYQLKGIFRDAAASIAHDIATKELHPGVTATAILLALPQMKDKHAALIAELTTIAVAKKLQAAA